MNLDLTGKKAIVCGSTQGLGFASALELALLGAEVTLMARDEKKLMEALKKLDTSTEQKHKYIIADFRSPQVVENSIHNYLANNYTVNILVNNTGGPKGGNAVDATPEEFLNAFNSHLICNHILTKAVLPSMKASGYGKSVV